MTLNLEIDIRYAPTVNNLFPIIVVRLETPSSPSVFASFL
jgi:hypothetical protein